MHQHTPMQTPALRVQNRRCLVLDGGQCNTVRALRATDTPREAADIVVPNNCTETYLAIQGTGLCRADWKPQKHASPPCLRLPEEKDTLSCSHLGSPPFLNTSEEPWVPQKGCAGTRVF